MIKSGSSKKPSFRMELEDMDVPSDFIKWVGRKGFKQAWEECPNAVWLLSFARRSIGRNGITQDAVELAACACAETALKYVLEGEERPRLAIEASRRDIAERTAESRKARDAAAADAYVAVTRDGAWGDPTTTAAAWAAYDASRDARFAPWAAADAAWAVATIETTYNAGDVAKKAALKSMAHIVREIIKPKF